jgi:hypothetical protein
MRKDDGAAAPMRDVAAVSAANDGRAGRGLLDPAPSGNSGTTPSSAAVAFVTVTAVEVVPTVGEGEGIRGGTVLMGLSTSRGSFLSSKCSGPGSGTDALSLF